MNDKMNEYPRLAEMGVLHPGQIRDYAVNSINYMDVLRITYERPKGSLLPVSRTYRFPRVKRTVEGRAKGGDAETVMETNPELTVALQELENLCGKRKLSSHIAKSILEEISHLEEDIAMRGNNIKALLKQIESQD